MPELMSWSIVFSIELQWNQLSLDIRVSDNVNIFKSGVKKFFQWFLSSFYISVFSETIILSCFYIFLGDLFLYGV